MKCYIIQSCRIEPVDTTLCMRLTVTFFFLYFPFSFTSVNIKLEGKVSEITVHLCLFAFFDFFFLSSKLSQIFFFFANVDSVT